MEYIATVSIQRAARGEGDVPVVMIAASGSSHGARSSEESMRLALTEALKVIEAALAARERQ